jgi:hypothetical protein
MPHWMRRWLDWARTELRFRRRRLIAGSPIVRVDVGGVVLDGLDGGPIPWCAGSVQIEIALRLPATGRVRTEFTLTIPGTEPVAAESIRPIESEGRIPRSRILFRIPGPVESGEAVVAWNGTSLVGIHLNAISREAYFAELRLDELQTFVRVDRRCVAGNTFVASRQRGCHATARLSNRFGLAPLAVVELQVDFAGTRFTLPLTSAQLAGTEARISTAAVRLPREPGTWHCRWLCENLPLGEVAFRGVTRREFRESVRVRRSGFLVELNGGRLILTPQPPTDAVVRLAGVFVVESDLPGAVGLVAMTLHCVGTATDPAYRPAPTRVFVADGPKEVPPRFLPCDQLHHLTALELRIGRRVLSSLTMSVVPTATLDAEGAFKSGPDFPWSTAADEELQRRLKNLTESP